MDGLFFDAYSVGYPHFSISNKLIFCIYDMNGKLCPMKQITKVNIMTKSIQNMNTRIEKSTIKL